MLLHMETISNISKQALYLTTCLILDFQEHAFIEVREMHLSGAGSACAKHVHFNYCCKDIVLEVQNETCSYI